jgi:hypothetical protein
VSSASILASRACNCARSAAVNGANDFASTRSDTAWPASQHRLAFRREVMQDRAPLAGHAVDQAAFDHAVGERAEGLVGLEGQAGQLVRRRVRVARDRAQRVALRQRRADLDQSGVQRAVVAVLDALDRESQRKEV